MHIIWAVCEAAAREQWDNHALSELKRAALVVVTNARGTTPAGPAKQPADRVAGNPKPSGFCVGGLDRVHLIASPRLSPTFIPFVLLPKNLRDSSSAAVPLTAALGLNASSSPQVDHTA